MVRKKIISSKTQRESKAQLESDTTKENDDK